LRAVDPGLHDDAAGVPAPVQGRYRDRDAQAMAGHVIQQRDLPVQAGRLAAGPAGRQPPPADPHFQDRVAVPAAQRPDHLETAPQSEKLLHPTIMRAGSTFLIPPITAAPRRGPGCRHD
jgi:hypothetical protein